jgi:hypothetical protein
LAREFRSVRVAVASARKNTTLKAYCIYDGPECRETEWLRQQNVTIQRKPSLEADLKPAYGENYDTFRGHWLRVDLPVIEIEAEQILYTDVDVVFLRDPRSFIFAPTYMAVCEERALGDRRHFNSGVMVMNLPRLRAVRPWLVRQVRHRLANNFRYPAHDQKSLNDFFLEQIEWMDPIFNWKPYRGYNSDAAIVHFQGPKPWHVHAIREGKAANMKPAFKALHDASPNGYTRFMEIFSRF